MNRPPLSEIANDPTGIVFRSDLVKAGWPERTVDGLFRRCARREPGCRRPYVLVSDVFTTTSNTTTTVAIATMSSAPPATIGGAVGTVYIIPRGEGDSRRFHVRYKLGDRTVHYAGSFRRRSDAVLRRQYVSGLIAAGHGRDIRRILRSQESNEITVSEAGKRWLSTRIDISAHTRRIHGDSLRRLEGLIGERPIAELMVDEIQKAIAKLAEEHKPSTVRKSLNVLQQALDHAELNPNPARSPRIRLPKQGRVTINPPETEHVEAVVRLLPRVTACRFSPWTQPARGSASCAT